MACTLVFYYTAISGSSSFNRDITKTLSGIAVSFGSVIYSNGNRWSDVDVTFDNGSVERIALIRNSSSTHTATNLRLVGCEPEKKDYDCINDVCIESGKYEWNQIKDLAGKLRNKNCG